MHVWYVGAVWRVCTCTRVCVHVCFAFVLTSIPVYFCSQDLLMTSFHLGKPDYGSVRILTSWPQRSRICHGRNMATFHYRLSSVNNSCMYKLFHSHPVIHDCMNNKSHFPRHHDQLFMYHHLSQAWWSWETVAAKLEQASVYIYTPCSHIDACMHYGVCCCLYVDACTMVQCTCMGYQLRKHLSACHVNEASYCLYNYIPSYINTWVPCVWG